MATPYAFVTLVTSDFYLPGALALAAALKDLHPSPPSPPEVDFQTVCLVTPETVDVSLPPDPTVRRGLMVIAKIIQNLANNILFGKEAHMVILNDFLKDNIVTVTKFLSEINVSLQRLADSEDALSELLIEIHPARP